MCCFSANNNEYRGGIPYTEFSKVGSKHFLNYNVYDRNRHGHDVRDDGVIRVAVKLSRQGDDAKIIACSKIVRKIALKIVVQNKTTHAKFSQAD